MRVSLRGKVDSDNAKAAAASVARAVAGVKSVRNDLRLVPAGDRKATGAFDTDITRQVEGRLAKDAQLKRVGVRTDGGPSSSRVPCRASTPAPTPLSLPVACRASAWFRNELTYDPAKRDGLARRRRWGNDEGNGTEGQLDGGR
jgi:hypothetical protein